MTASIRGLPGDCCNGKSRCLYLLRGAEIGGFAAAEESGHGRSQTGSTEAVSTLVVMYRFTVSCRLHKITPQSKPAKLIPGSTTW